MFTCTFTNCGMVVVVVHISFDVGTTLVDVEFAEGLVGNDLFLCLVDAPARVALLPQERPALVRADLSPESFCNFNTSDFSFGSCLYKQ